MALPGLIDPELQLGEKPGRQDLIQRQADFGHYGLFQACAQSLLDPGAKLFHGGEGQTLWRLFTDDDVTHTWILHETHFI